MRREKTSFFVDGITRLLYIPCMKATVTTATGKTTEHKSLKAAVQYCETVLGVCAFTGRKLYADELPAMFFESDADYMAGNAAATIAKAGT